MAIKMKPSVGVPDARAARLVLPLIADALRDTQKKRGEVIALAPRPAAQQPHGRPVESSGQP